VVVAYFVKASIEKKIDGVEDRITEVARASLDIKKDLRSEERGDLVDFRVALSNWEDFLRDVLFEYSNGSPSKADSEADALFAKDTELFNQVKTGALKASIYLRDEQLEGRFMSSILKVRKLYYPLLYQRLPVLIDLGTQLAPLNSKLEKFRESGMTDMQFAPTRADLELSKRTQAAMTEQVQEFANEVVANSKPIAEEMDSLKKQINQYIYRPIRSTEIDRD
jgi:hypothetical protein